MKITVEQLIKDSKLLAQKINKSYRYVYGVPTGGILPAYIISQELDIELVNFFSKEMEDILIVDDILDSGRTFQEFNVSDTAILYNKGISEIKPTYQLRELKNEWISLPFEKETGIEEHITRIFEYIGENPNREGLKDTPKRIVQMWKEIFRGYDEKQKPKITVFENGKDGLSYDQMILDSGNFYSFCAHHMIPFRGWYYFAYIPDRKILGLSKVARIVDYYSAKLQVQEQLTKEIVDEIEKQIEPKGIALVLKAQHLCKEMRGVRKIGGEMITSDLRGCFRNEQETRSEFMNFINN